MLFIMLVMSSCRQADPETAAQEVPMHKWSIENDTEKGELSFESDIMTLFFTDENKNNTKFSGKYYADDNSIYMETEDGMTVKFEYRLEDDKLYMKYSEREICFYKE